MVMHAPTGAYAASAASNIPFFVQRLCDAMHGGREEATMALYPPPSRTGERGYNEYTTSVVISTMGVFYQLAEADEAHKVAIVRAGGLTPLQELKRKNVAVAMISLDKIATAESAAAREWLREQGLAPDVYMPIVNMLGVDLTRIAMRVVKVGPRDIAAGAFFVSADAAADLVLLQRLSAALKLKDARVLTDATRLHDALLAHWAREGPWLAGTDGREASERLFLTLRREGGWWAEPPPCSKLLFSHDLVFEKDKAGSAGKAHVYPDPSYP
eukprot:1503531-Prymnesium_polylepis.1